ncbi:Fic family protein [Peptacetobacter hominis]|uniref:Fic family protein n=1 Tax=Peptacetobacter hominis TaxID=2743610 RepID=A0A544QU32_9FIRM|nr:Fic family protein [Peptacetobacter hominis]TQQ84192.1 Fic family protein [Peptacetobacter hominis]
MDYKLLSSLYYSNNDKYNEIYIKRFESESSYHFGIDINGKEAFMIINNEILNQVSDIHKLDKMLIKTKALLPPIALQEYKKKCIIDEIKATNDIESVYSTRKEISEIITNLESISDKKRFYGIIKKYELLDKNEYSDISNCQDIRNIYDETMFRDIELSDKEDLPDGKIFRKDKVWVNNKHQKTVHTGLYPEDKIIEAMDKAISVLNNESINFLVRIAVFHYLFEYIHPFYDGNGRMGRLISSMLMTKELDSFVAYRLSYTILKDKDKYYKSFNITGDKKNLSDLTPFVIYFFEFIKKSIRSLIEGLIYRADKLSFYGDKIYDLVNKNYLDEKYIDILYILIQNNLFGETLFGVSELALHSKCGETTVRKFIRKLTEEGYVKKEKDGKRYVFDIIYDKLDNI